MKLFFTVIPSNESFVLDKCYMYEEKLDRRIPIENGLEEFTAPPSLPDDAANVYVSFITFRQQAGTEDQTDGEPMAEIDGIFSTAEECAARCRELAVALECSNFGNGRTKLPALTYTQLRDIREKLAKTSCSHQWDDFFSHGHAICGMKVQVVHTKPPVYGDDRVFFRATQS
jgi:hypothetical protein